MHQNSGDALKGDKRGGLRRKHKVQVAFAQNAEQTKYPSPSLCNFLAK